MSAFFYSASFKFFCGLFNQRLQFAALQHLNDDVATADQFAIHPQLREGRPVSVFRQLGTNIRVLQNIHVSKPLTTG
ncbi:hypothetical protein HA42_15645 [Pantoea deleyi]|nr:hypothetical protein HA42_15645 [Pantoea deleyi]